MSKKHKEKKDNKIKSKLNNQQRKDVDDIEKYVDAQIDAQWESGNIVLDYDIVTFQIHPTTGLPLGYSDDVRSNMTNLLIGRFKDGGWRVSVVPGESTKDGVNKTAYWVLKVKPGQKSKIK